MSSGAPSPEPPPTAPRAPPAGSAGFVLLHFTASRLLYLAAAVLSHLLLTGGNAERIDLPSLAQLQDLCRRALFFADSGWYWNVMQDGYTVKPFAAGQEDWGFFPLYPLLIRALGSSVLAGILVSHAAAFTALLLLYGSVRRRCDERTARWTVRLLAYFPTTWFVSSFRPDGLLFLLMVLVFELAERRRLAWVCLVSFLCVLTKQNGVVIAPALCAYWLVEHRFRPGQVPPLHWVAALAPTACALGGLSLYFWHITGEPLAWTKVQQAWGRELASPAGPMLRWLRDPVLVAHGGWNLSLLNFAGVIACLAIGIAMLRRWRTSLDHAVFCLSLALLSLACGGEWNFLRYSAFCWPAFVYLARSCRDETLTVVLAASSALLALYATWIALDVHAAMG